MKGMLGIAGVLAASASILAGEENIPRSIYVPVAFRTCEHLVSTTLFMGDQALGSLPTERIFVFTYYPHLKRVEPEFNELRVEGVRTEDGSPFQGYLAVAANTISTANEQIDLDFDRIRQQLSYRIDGRYEKVRVVVRCEEGCQRKDHTPTTALLEGSSPPELVEEP